MRRAAWAPVARLLTATGFIAACGETIAPISLDISKNCNAVDVTVISKDGGLVPGAGEQLVAATADGNRKTSAWTLVAPLSTPERGLIARHWSDGRILSEVDLGVPIADAAATRLHASPEAGEVYVTRRGEADFRLWRVIERDPLPFVQGSGQLAAFPEDTHNCGPRDPCDAALWHRDLIFLSGQPFLISVPPFSPTVAISVWVGGLQRPEAGLGDFELGTEHRLNFEPRCDPDLALPALEECEFENSLVRHPLVEVMGLQRDPRLGTAAVLAMRQRSADTLVTTFDFFAVLIGLDDDGIPAGILRSEQSDADPTQPPDRDAELAVDGFATYARVSHPTQGVRLLRLELARFEQGFDELPVPGGPVQSLLQLDRDIALGRVVDGAWQIDKLFPDAIDQSQTTVYRTDSPIVEVRGVGPSVFEVRRQSGPSEIVRVGCRSVEVDP